MLLFFREIERSVCGCIRPERVRYEVIGKSTSQWRYSWSLQRSREEGRSRKTDDPASATK